MANVTAYTKSGTKASTAVTLPKEVFDVEVKNHELIGQAYRAYLANGRSNNAVALRRGEVRGGGRKPWRQKGTGRARVGSIRVPNWRGGGVTFGPTGSENYKIKLNVKAKRQAIKQALSLKAKDDALKVIETFSCPEGKVKPTVELLDKLKAGRKVLLVVSVKDDLVERATRNIPGIKAMAANYLNVYDIINADTIIISKKSLDIIKDWLTSKPKKVAEPKETKKPVATKEAKA